MLVHIKGVDETPEEATFLIENSAGQKGKIGSSLEEVKDLMEAIDSDRVGWCYDTCHGHAAGYEHGSSNLEYRNSKQIQNSKTETDSRTSNLADGTSNVLEEIENLDLLESLKVIHVNDSRDTFDSGRDRHDNLGEGNIPDEDLKVFLNDTRIKDIPLILEVPGFDKKGPDAKNVSILKSWIS